jgi:hypothetical protein
VVQNLTKADRLRLEIRHGKSQIFVTE